MMLALLPDCKGEGVAGSFEKFIAPFPPPATGSRLPEMCTAANDGKRFWLDGYLQLPNSISINKGKTSLNFYERIDGTGRGAGRSLTIDVTSPGDIDDLWAAATGKKSAGFRSQKAQIDPEALRINTIKGVATARDKIKLTFDISAIKHFQTGEITICLYQLVKSEKL
jgi:hypothetical protein